MESRLRELILIEMSRRRLERLNRMEELRLQESNRIEELKVEGMRSDEFSKEWMSESQTTPETTP
jgi:hypothetical protein